MNETAKSKLTATPWTPWTRREFFSFTVRGMAVLSVAGFVQSTAAESCPARAYGSGLYGRNCYAGYPARLSPVSQTAADIQRSGFRLRVFGEGNRVVVERSDDLMRWTPLSAEGIVAPSEDVEVIDPGATNAMKRFYRARVVN